MVIPVLGVMAVLERVGARLVTVRVMLSVALSPSESLTVIVQVMTSSGMAPLVDKSIVADVPMTFPPMLHS